MPENQQEKIIRFLKGRYKSMEDVASLMDMSRANLYLKFKEVPLNEDFVNKAKNRLMIDLNTLSNIETNVAGDYWKNKYNEALMENEKLHNDNVQLRDTIADKKKLIDKYEQEIIRLQDEITALKKQA